MGEVMTRLEKAAYLSEIIGAVAVVVSLIYVGRQIADNDVHPPLSSGSIQDRPLLNAGDAVA